MKIGIKVGLFGDPVHDLITAKPDFCEVWFHSGQISDYASLLSQTNRLGIPSGLHFWGALTDGTLANFAYPDTQILTDSRKLARNTLITAAKNKCLYVNFHPNGSLLTKVDFVKQEFKPYTKSAPLDLCLENLHESFSEITSFAQDLGIPIFFESVPKRALGNPWTGLGGRNKPTYIGEFCIEDIESMLELPNLYFANDLGHTAGNLITDDRTAIRDYIFKITQKLAPLTKLLHVSYIIPPYNGTDYHGLLYSDEFKSETAVLNYFEMQKLLQIFLHREDVLALVEPETDHVGNYLELQKLILKAFKI